MIYDKYSMKSKEFISNEEILRTISFGKENMNNQTVLKRYLNKAKKGQGLNHREAYTLLMCQDKKINKEIFELAKKIKEKNYGNRIVLFAPLYLSNYCINGCIYCPYHYQNKNITRKQLSQKEIIEEVKALQDMGHKRLALETGEDPIYASLDYVLESIKTIYSIHHKNGDIRRVNVNIAATSVENYEKLKDAGIGTYILFQETYHKENYEKLHPKGPKHNYEYHTEAMDRAMLGGIDDVGLGVLFGLNNYEYDFIGLLMHSEHLEAAFGVGPHTISVPRIRPADDIDPEEFDNSIDDETFSKIIAMIRIATPYTGMIMSTREGKSMREKALKLGISQISGASKTSVGGYAKEQDNRTKPQKSEVENSEQFDTADKRTLDEIVSWLIDQEFIPSFCTACYREGRTGDRFMSLVKSGQIGNVCRPNALLTLQEYLNDYASEETKIKGFKIINKEIAKIENPRAKKQAEKWLEDIRNGNRDFRF